MRAAVCILMAAAAAVGQDPTPGPHPVDAGLERLWTDQGVAPAPRSNDSEFFRRLALDLTGRIPTPEAVRAFIAAPDRPPAIDRLLQSADFLDFWSQRLTNALLGYARDAEYLTNRAGFQAWMRKQLEEDRGWDSICGDALTASGDPVRRPEVSFIAQFVEPGPEAQRLKVEDLTGRVATAFLGLRLRCAQCHDHPSDRWTQEDFYGVVAYFQRTGGTVGERGAVGVRTSRTPIGYRFEHWTSALQPRFLGGRAPETDNLRVELSEVVTQHDQFARAFVNRIWAYLFGRGLVDPYDDFAPRNRAVAPQLLEDLAAWAREKRFSVKSLVRLIVTSQAYQRTSRADGDATAQERLFARSATRPLAPEQLWNAIEQATMLRESDLDRKAISRLAGGTQALASAVPTYELLKNWFLGMLVRTSNPDAPANLGRYSANVQQVLVAMNAQSPIWSGIRALGGGRLDKLTLLSDDPGPIVEELFLACLGRLPYDGERERTRHHISLRGKKGMEDVFWALLNADEFIFNH